MALERALWQRVRKAGLQLKKEGHGVHLTRIENMVGEGTPDVEGCIDSVQIWAELKSCARPARSTTPIRPKKRQSQTDWHRDRTQAGFKNLFVLIQVGEASQAKLYLIPGNLANQITSTENELELMSVLSYSSMPMTQVLLRARGGW